MDGTVMSRRPLALRNLCVLAYANGFTLWHYRAPGILIDDVMKPGFFRDAREMMSPGDAIYVSAADGVANLYVTAGMEIAPVRAGSLEDCP